MMVANSSGMKPKEPALIGKNRMPAPTAVPNNVITQVEVEPAGSAFFFFRCFVLVGLAWLTPSECTPVLLAFWLFVLIAVAFLFELGAGRCLLAASCLGDELYSS